MAQSASTLHVFKAIARGRFIYLLAFLFLSVLLFPFLEEASYGPLIMQVLYSFMFISALYAVAAVRWIFHIGILLFVAALSSRWWIILSLSPMAVVVGIIFEIIFFCFVALSLLSNVFGHEQVSGDTIAGAVCVFFLIGIISALAYQGIYFFNHRAFNNIAAGSFSPAATVDLVYYSFATLTTLGYGDITPISKVARMIAVTEALVGQIYLTVLVARLVGLYAPVRASRAGR
jgi:voltage-gated potassium channel